MKMVAVEDAHLTAEELATMALEETVILTRKGMPLVAVKDISAFDWESVSLANNPRFVAIIEESRRSYRDQGGITLDAIRKELGLKPRRRRSKGEKGSGPSTVPQST